MKGGKRTVLMRDRDLPYFSFPFHVPLPLDNTVSVIHLEREIKIKKIIINVINKRFRLPIVAALYSHYSQDNLGY